MAVFNYWCENCNCGAKVSQQNFQVNKSEEEENVPEICPNSEHLEMKLMGQEMSGGYAKFSAMTPTQKKEVLKKRSRAHYQKEIKEKKLNMNRELGLDDNGKFNPPKSRKIY